MESVQVGRWLVRYDPETTRDAFGRFASVQPETCDCDVCRNLLAAFEFVFTPEALAVFDRLGVDPRRASDLYRTYPAEPDLLVEGWYHFVGRIETERESEVEAADTPWPSDPTDFVALGPRLAVACRSRADVVPEAFRGFPLVQLEFEALVPWVIDAPRPT